MCEFCHKRVHYGQVVPIEDLERILGFVNTVVRLPCICRKITLGKEKRYCSGCGICRAACSKEAISLLDRASVPASANLVFRNPR